MVCKLKAALGMHHNTKLHCNCRVCDCMCGYIFYLDLRCIKDRWIDHSIPDWSYFPAYNGDFLFQTVPTPLYGRVITEKE